MESGDLRKAIIPIDDNQTTTLSTTLNLVTPSVEIRTQGIPYCEDRSLIPVVGMVFPCLEEGMQFDRTYAEACGFMIRTEGEKRVDGVITHKNLCVIGKGRVT
ncbi:hypothetical protein RND81_04G024400 [Saponaria officinalis]|uniref:Uncharacterized protein n=1 Tax=Saponaria officinalis TaxID=3572 RepID=A0AAW1LIL8_SAPOF